jgi:hypothetical protein
MVAHQSPPIGRPFKCSACAVLHLIFETEEAD